ncbi:hypothetical protein [Neorhizobium sp. DT-125]|uniref:hypothetical protein n=1 Tax=Neorhizobium sp. DT-125 TaxID=3396163 RepID=UPI003F199EBB
MATVLGCMADDIAGVIDLAQSRAVARLHSGHSMALLLPPGIDLHKMLSSRGVVQSERLVRTYDVEWD